jgi:hypothetical protein
MNKIDYTALAVLMLLSCVPLQVLCASPASAPAVPAKTGRTLQAVDIRNLPQHWIHSSEEERPGDKDRMFRPAGSRSFPPSRFRMAYKFARNGSCEFYFLSSDDAHYYKACTWTISEHENVILRISAEGVTTSYRITELSATLLRLTPLESQGPQ